MDANTPTETQSTPQAQEQPKDTRSQMIEDLNKLQSEASEGEEPKAEEPVVEATEDQESSEEVEDSEEAEDSEESDDSKDKKKKPNRYQKLKAREQAVRELAQKNASERDDAVKIANVFRNRYLQTEAMLKNIIAQVKANGFEVSEHQLENIQLKQRQSEQDLMKNIEEQQEKERIKTEIETTRKEMALDFATTSFNLAKRFAPDVTFDQQKSIARQILRVHALRLESGEESTIQQSAKEVFSLLQKSNPEREQLEANDRAPRTFKPGKAAPIKYESRRDEAVAFLDSLMKEGR
jgi:hypothetical protein